MDEPFLGDRLYGMSGGSGRSSLGDYGGWVNYCYSDTVGQAERFRLFIKMWWSRTSVGGAILISRSWRTNAIICLPRRRDFPGFDPRSTWVSVWARPASGVKLEGGY